MLQIDEPKSGLSVSLINSYFAFHIFLFSFLLFSITALLQSQAAQAHMFEFGLQRSFGRNILELLVYYLMPNKCKNLKDTKSSCLSICTSSL